MKEIFQKIRKYEIRIRKAVKSQMQGDFHSIFKGSGLEFDDVRAYQYGDDVRSIDWHVTAKGHGTYIKTFKEEKEQTVFFLVDVSASQQIGKKGKQKIDITNEITSVLSLSAVKEGSSVGAICFSDQKEKYIKAGKGESQAYQLITSLYKLVPKSKRTSLNKGIESCLNLVRRKSIIILISDFIDEGYERNLKSLAKRHDLVVLHIFDQRETKLPRLGIIPLYDKESEKTIWVNTSSAHFRNKIANKYGGNQNKLKELCQKYEANYLRIDTEEDYVPQLIKLFKVRNLSKKNG
ncbi:DUF58 domain-containing protein [Persicobacter psychrovividus]|uniref:DUF58 domain-containing protein n=1 Tax=Persicobacter psychrovividus TaxID=387638 RepID=A0ABN6L5P8_9BACT|nr:hypothetical protein PEPS_07510 [Persicobacter psychrovividus]